MLRCQTARCRISLLINEPGDDGKDALKFSMERRCVVGQRPATGCGFVSLQVFEGFGQTRRVQIVGLHPVMKNHSRHSPAVFDICPEVARKPQIVIPPGIRFHRDDADTLRIQAGTDLRPQIRFRRNRFIEIGDVQRPSWIACRNGHRQNVM